MRAPILSHLIATVDYELYGDGRGDLRATLIEPTAAMLRIAERYAVPLTLFVDVSEFQRMGEVARPDTPLRVGLDQVRAQLLGALHRGHDVQLHLHPQWTGARPGPEAGWTVDRSRWRIGDLPAPEVARLVREGVAWLRDWLHDAPEGWRCQVFRAGAWAIQPEAHVLTALRDVGIRIDSTVAPGLVHQRTLDWFDFRDAPRERAWWPIRDDVCRPEPSGDLIEVPIATASLGLRGGLQVVRRRLRRPSSGGLGQGASSGRLGRVAGAAIGRLRSGTVQKLDFSALEADHLRRIASAWMQRETGDRPLPLVAIAHSKTFTEHSAEAFARWLGWAAVQPGVEPATFGRWLETA